MFHQNISGSVRAFGYLHFWKNIDAVPDTRKSIQKLSNLGYYDSKSRKLTHFETYFAPEIQIPKYMKHLLTRDTSRKNSENP